MVWCQAVPSPSLGSPSFSRERSGGGLSLPSQTLLLVPLTREKEAQHPTQKHNNNHITLGLMQVKKRFLWNSFDPSCCFDCEKVISGKWVGGGREGGGKGILQWESPVQKSAVPHPQNFFLGFFFPGGGAPKSV